MLSKSVLNTGMTSSLPWTLFCLAVVSLQFATSDGYAFPQNVQETEMTNYWNKKLPSSTMPANIKNRISPLSHAQLETFKELIKAGQLLSDATVASAFCSAGDLLCAGLDKILPKSMAREDRGRHFYYYENAALAVHHTQDISLSKDDSTDQIRYSWFLEKNLMTGVGAAAGFQVPARELYSDLHQATHRSFLPRDLAELVGLDLANTLHQLHIPESSMLGRVMQETADLCATTNSTDLISTCVFSLEDLVDYVAETLHQGSGAGSGAIEALSSSGISPSDYKLLQGSRFKVVRVEQKADKHSMYLSCHFLLFPYLTTLCHHIPATKIFSVTLESTGVEGYTIINTVLCHMDTSKWSPDHIVFKVLGTTPGQTEACHLSSQDEFAFVVSRGKTDP